ncbi:MAG: type II secretion system protein [Kiritimatiellae bacterium]|nr:type II secretion system protein [Kiritimatiellia bacterium]
MTISFYEIASRRLQSTPVDASRAVRSRAAFTLIELLMVVMVITMLFGILLSAIRTVQRHTLQTVTRAEIKNIENAWKQYFAHYQMWPTNPPPYRIDAAMARSLQGVEANSAINPDSLVFMEFSRFALDGRPLNAWGDSGRHPNDLCSYYVFFDNDGDNEVSVPLYAGLETPDTTTTTNLLRGVAVWTYNPEIKDSGGNPVVLGSWQQ